MTHWDLSDKEFLIQFRESTLSEELFTHEAHIRLAWLHIDRFGLGAAEINVSDQLKNYTKSLGAESKYHHTVTIAAVKAVNHFKEKSATENFEDFITENPRLNTDFKALLAQHYQTDIFNSDLAKTEFLEPELTQF